MTKKCKKITAEKNYIFFRSKTTIYLSLGLQENVQVSEKTFSSQKRPSNTSKHELLNFFLLLWVIFALLDPDPDSESGSGSGSATLVFCYIMFIPGDFPPAV
jgi:hypothetical protein